MIIKIIYLLHKYFAFMFNKQFLLNAFLLNCIFIKQLCCVLCLNFYTININNFVTVIYILLPLDIYFSFVHKNEQL